MTEAPPKYIRLDDTFSLIAKLGEISIALLTASRHLAEADTASARVANDRAGLRMQELIDALSEVATREAGDHRGGGDVS